MKAIHYLPIMALAVTSVACDNQSKQKESIQYDVNNLDTTAVLGNDFYQYATGGWQAANPLKDQYARFGSFDVLAERNKEQIKGLIDDLGKATHETGTVGQKIGDMFAVGIDSVKLNADGVAPIKPHLEAIEAAKEKQDVIKLIADIAVYAGTPFMGIGVGTDSGDSDKNIMHLYAAGLGLGDRDYYLKDDETSVALRKGYQELIVKQFKNAGFDDAVAEKASTDILKIETSLAKAFPTKESRRDPVLNYNKIAVTDLNAKVAKFAWEEFFAACTTEKFEVVDAGQTQGLKEAVRLINTLPIEEMKEYLSWKVINSASSYLSDDFANANFNFYGKQMSGQKEMQPRWRRVVSNVEGVLGEAVGQMYVEKYFPAEAKERMVGLVKNLQTSLGERIQNLTWMSDVTKTKAQEKLSTFHVKIGYPDKWKDYSALKIEKDSYWANIVRASKFAVAENLAKVNKPVDKEEWHMPPQMVNAYYNPTTNEICFPAGILQAPFFYLDGDDAVNYGAIGVVIGHEMSHGFDDQGCQFDKDGNLKNWWTEEDKKQFDERAQVLVNHFDNIQLFPDLKANGKYTLGENIGDFGGLQVAYNAFNKTQQAKEGSKIEGFTPQQRFFLSYAGVWAGHIRDAEARRLTQLDVHSLGEWRVNGTLPHVDGWYEAFGIKEGDKLYLAKEKRADIW